MTLIEMLSTVEDPRSPHGLRYTMTDTLLMCCIMAMMSGYSGYREIGRFLERNEKDFRSSFGAYHGVPCYVTIRDVLQRCNFMMSNPASAKMRVENKSNKITVTSAALDSMYITNAVVIH